MKKNKTMLNKNLDKKNSPKDSLRKNISRKEKSKNTLYTDIFKLIEENNLKKMQELLKKEHYKINILNKEGFAPLHISVIKRNLEMINLLLLNGANPNVLTSNKKQTPLHLAYIYKNPKTDEIIKKLKKFKANENIEDIDNKKPLDYLNRSNINIINTDNYIFKNKKDDKKEINKNKDYNIKKNSNSISSGALTKFSKIVAKIEGDVDNCENDEDNDFDNNENEIIDEKHFYQIDIKNNNKKNIFNSDNYEINYNDSLENEVNKNNKPNIQNRKILLKKQNKTTSNYPILFNKIINNNLKKRELIQNKSYNNFNSFNNNSNNSNVDQVFKEIIKKKRQSIKYRKSNSFFNIKKSSKSNEYIFPTESNYISNYKSDYNKSIEKYRSIKQKEKNYNTKASSISQSNTGFMTAFTTENKSKHRNTKDKITIITNKDVVEFKYGDSYTEENNSSLKESKNDSINNSGNKNYKQITTNNVINHNTSFNVLNKDTYTYNGIYTNALTNKNINNNETGFENIDSNRLKIYPELKNWLENIGLSIYYQNFIENNIYNINSLIKQMKNPDTKLGYDDIESILKIHKPGHIYRLLCNLEIEAGLINENVIQFLIKKNKHIIKDNTFKKSNNKLKLSISHENGINNCLNCIRINFLNSNKKNDLKSFLNRYNISNFFQNFYHNGFDMINFVMVQMFSSEPIDHIVLENYFHIYEPEQRDIVLKCILEEKNKINFFLNSNEYLNLDLKDTIKYEDIIFEDNNDHNNKITIPKNNSCTDCIII